MKEKFEKSNAKKKRFTAVAFFVAVALLFACCIATMTACKKTPETPPPGTVTPGDDTPGGNTPGGDDTPGGNDTPGGDDTPGGNDTPGGETPADYQEGDLLIRTDLKYDIANEVAAFYIGSNCVSSVKVNGTAVSKENYTITNKYLLMPDDWYETLGEGTHSVEILYKTKTLTFTVKIEDNREILYTLPEGELFYVPLDKAELPLAEFKSESQNKKVTYTVSNSGGTVESEQKGDKLVLTDPEIGEYTYRIKIERGEQLIAEKEYAVKLVTREYYDGIIDTADGATHSDVADIWKVNSTNATVSYEEHTDSESVTKKAIKYENNSTSDMDERILSISAQKLLDLMRLGYKTITFDYCCDTDSVGVELGLYNPYYGTYGSLERASEVNTQWKHAEIDITRLGVTIKSLIEKIDADDFKFGFLTRKIVSGDVNGPRTVWLSEVIAGGCKETDITAYAGAYVSGGETVEIQSDGTATYGDEDYVVRISNSVIVLTDENADKICGSIYNGALILDGKVFGKADITVDLVGDMKVPLAYLPAFVDQGYTVKYYVKEKDNDDDREEATEYKFDSSKQYIVYAEIFNGQVSLGDFAATPVLNTIYTRNLADFNELNAIELELLTATEGCELRYQTVNSIANQLSNNRKSSTANTEGDGVGDMIIDGDFVQGSIQKGYTQITIKGRCYYNGVTYGSTLVNLVQYDASENRFITYAGSVAQYANNFEFKYVFDSGFTLGADDYIGISNIRSGPGIVFYTIQFSTPETLATPSVTDVQNIVPEAVVNNLVGAQAPGGEIEMDATDNNRTQWKYNRHNDKASNMMLNGDFVKACVEDNNDWITVEYTYVKGTAPVLQLVKYDAATGTNTVLATGKAVSAASKTAQFSYQIQAADLVLQPGNHIGFILSEVGAAVRFTRIKFDAKGETEPVEPDIPDLPDPTTTGDLAKDPNKNFEYVGNGGTLSKIIPDVDKERQCTMMTHYGDNGVSVQINDIVIKQAHKYGLTKFHLKLRWSNSGYGYPGALAGGFGGDFESLGDNIELVKYKVVNGEIQIVKKFYRMKQVDKDGDRGIHLGQPEPEFTVDIDLQDLVLGEGEHIGFSGMIGSKAGGYTNHRFFECTFTKPASTGN